jgi:excinuclease UvrABC ATPase subunit
MEKTGRQRVKTERCDKRKRKCANCGGRGVYKVIYEDMYSKLVVTLCEECEKLGYGQLKLQTQLDWPVTT